MKNKFLRFAISFFLIFLISPLSCSIKTKEQKAFGYDAEYFIGLQLLNEGNTKAAISKFTSCAKKGSSLCSLESKRLLCSLGTAKQREKACKKLLSENPDSRSLLSILRYYESINDFKTIMKITENLEITQENNKLIKLRLETLFKAQSPKLIKETYDWFSELPISNEHYSFYRDSISKLQSFSNDTPSELNPKEFAIYYRIQTYKRDYIFTYNNSERLINYFEDNTLEPSAQLASDIGKSFLYGNSDVIPNAMYFSDLAEKYKNTPMEFYFWFYAGRLFDKGSLYNTKTKKSFENAINCTDNVQLKDNAIWYLLNTSFTSDINLVLPLLQKYAALWNDPTYFDDFFDALSSAIFTTGDWQLFHKVFKAIENYASPSIVSQFAYLSARLIQTNHIKGTQDDMINCFKKAYICNGSIYYQNLAKYQLIQNKIDIKSLDSKIKVSTPSEPINYDAAILLEGYATFGFPEKIFKTWNSLKNKNIPQDKLIFLCEFLQKCGSYAEEDDYFYQSLIMAIKIEGQSKLKFPKNYEDLVEKYSKECEIDPTIIYSLIRSESFFDPDVSSVAGAIGLTQLMDFTASDIARKLKISEYSLTNPETNIQFGTYYLKNMISRLENDYLHGFFAYNAGITRVRRWLNTSILGFGKKSNMPSDLFLETLPYTETREYGRKLVTSSIMYKTLYSENPEQDFEEIIKLLIEF